jgi:hypothetical protein
LHTILQPALLNYTDFFVTDIPEVGEEEEEIVEKPMECDTDQLPAEHAGSFL